MISCYFFFFSSRRRHTRLQGDWSSDVCSSDLTDVKPLEVQVVAMDWKWLFFIPEKGIATVNELAAPVDRPIHFKLTATSTMIHHGLRRQREHLLRHHDDDHPDPDGRQELQLAV